MRNDDSSNLLPLRCGEFEVLLCDYLDGTLDPEIRAALEQHRDSCAACAEMFADVTGAVTFMERAESAEPPAELLTRISFHIPTNQSEGLKASGWRSWFGGWLQPVLQPKFAMGMAMTILSFSMLGRFAGIEIQQLKPSDLSPVKVWEAADDKLHRAWARGVKYYESLKIVYEVRSRLSEWSRLEEEERKTERPETEQPANSQKQNLGRSQVEK
ncbi:MAG TPA: zf-HC2 domain-containing protein [Bryobacteraceae bacterium]|jgi:hypothetical protein|nr:zf-HC2 domain-containing protein [Bryobacteraceae bacterium]